MSRNFQINTRQKALQAQRQAKPNATQHEVPSELHKAIVIKKNGEGYDVATVDAAGELGRIYERVFVWGGDGNDLELAQEVLLQVPRDGETPSILLTGAGGGGTTCSLMLNGFGVYTD